MRTSSAACCASTTGAHPGRALLAFTLGSTWSMANVSGGITGSPTPTVSGPLVRGTAGALFWYSGTGFASMGGWFD